MLREEQVERPACRSGRVRAARAEGVGCLHTVRGRAARPQAGARSSRRSILLGWRETSYELLEIVVQPTSPILKGRTHTPSKWRRLLRSLFSCPQKPKHHQTLMCRPGSRWEPGGCGPGGQRGAKAPQEGCGGRPGADSAALPGDAAGWRPGASKEAPSPARRHPAGLGRAPRAEGPRDSGAGLTHEEAEEVEADEQRPLAAALPRVVVERRAAPVLALRDDRLVVLVVLHGAGCGASLLTREDVPRQQPHTQMPGSPPGRSRLGEPRVGTGLGRDKNAISLPSSKCRRWCFLLTLCTSAFFPLSTPNRSKVQGEKSQIPSRNFCKAAPLGTRWA